MGWTFTKRYRGEKLTDFFVRQGTLCWSGTEFSYKVLDSALVNFTEYYAAVEKIENATGKREVWAAIFLIRMLRNPADGYNFGYKDMDETVGPCQHNCPERILKLLTPTEYEHAIDWRKQCWDRIEARKKAPTLKPGLAIAFTPPLAFRNGSTHDRMEVHRLRGSRVSMKDAEGYDGYVLSNQQLSKMILSGRATFPTVTP